MASRPAIISDNAARFITIVAATVKKALSPRAKEIAKLTMMLLMVTKASKLLLAGTVSGPA